MWLISQMYHQLMMLNGFVPVIIIVEHSDILRRSRPSLSSSSVRSTLTPSWVTSSDFLTTSTSDFTWLTWCQSVPTLSMPSSNSARWVSEIHRTKSTLSCWWAGLSLVTTFKNFRVSYVISLLIIVHELFCNLYLVTSVSYTHLTLPTILRV